MDGSSSRNQTDCAYEIFDFLSNRIRDRKGPLGEFKTHPNYGAWCEALEQLSTGGHKVRPGNTPSFARDLVNEGTDPDVIRTIFLLLFHDI